jgi:phage/plasmid primase-like uncharacterized protein
MKANRKSKMNTIKEDSAKINGSKSLKNKPLAPKKASKKQSTKMQKRSKKGVWKKSPDTSSMRPNVDLKTSKLSRRARRAHLPALKKICPPGFEAWQPHLYSSV